MSAPIHVLVVDDDEEDAALTTELLEEIDRAGYKVQWESTADRARDRIAEGSFDVCLVDYRLGPDRGVDLVREMVQEGSSLPFILLTAVNSREVDEQAIDAGAADYLVKGDITPALLERAIRYSLQAARAQTALRNSERRLREVAENVQEAFFVFDSTLQRLAYVNPSFEAIFQRSPDALSDSQALLEALHPDDRQEALAAFDELHAGRTVERECRVIWPDGSERWIRARAFPVIGPRGSLARVVGTAEDMTARRRADDARNLIASAGRLMETSRDLEQTLRNLASLFVPAFADACVIDVVDDTQQLQRRAWALVDPEQGQAVFELRRRPPLKQRPQHPLWQVLATGKTIFLSEVERSFAMQLADDPEERALAERVQATSCIVVPLTTGSRVLGVLFFGGDSSRRRFDQNDVLAAEEIARRAALAIENAQLYEAAERAREREHAQAERFRRLADVSREFAEAAPVLPELLGTVTRLIAEQLGDLCTLRLLSDDRLRLELAACHHRTLPSLSAAVQASDVPVPFDEAALAGVSDHSAVDAVRQVLRPLAIPGDFDRALPCRIDAYAVTPIRAQGQILGTLGVARESPAPQYSPDEFALLQQLADRAGVTIQNARLFAEAQHAVTTRKEVIAVVSHDVANPLHTICLGTSMLLANAVNDDNAQTLRRMQRAGEQASRIMRDLLDAAAIDAGHLSIAVTTEISARLIEDACEAFEQEARTASIMLQRGPVTPELAVIADRGRIVQVLVNLIGNAIRFTPAGGSISVGAKAQGADVRFTVRDTGYGMSEGQAARIFERHYQGQSVGHRGMGLGLTICKGLIDAHLGRIWVETSLGHGTAVHFTLPMAPENPPDDATREVQQPAPLRPFP